MGQTTAYGNSDVAGLLVNHKGRNESLESCQIHRLLALNQV